LEEQALTCSFARLRILYNVINTKFVTLSTNCSVFVHDRSKIVNIIADNCK